MGKYDTCTICKKDFEYCPHSREDRKVKAQDDHIRKIVREELRKHKCPCQINLGGL
jgi:hypothetical protein